MCTCVLHDPRRRWSGRQHVNGAHARCQQRLMGVPPAWVAAVGAAMVTMVVIR